VLSGHLLDEPALGRGEVTAHRLVADGDRHSGGPLLVQEVDEERHRERGEIVDHDRREPPLELPVLDHPGDAVEVGDDQLRDERRRLREPRDGEPK
jgi:hypothetical protein